MAGPTPQQIAQYKLFNGAPKNPLFPDPTQQPGASPMQPTATAPASPAPPQPQDSSVPRGQIASAMSQDANANAPQATMQGPPPVPTLAKPHQHGTLAKILLGVGEALGNPLASRINQQDRAMQEKYEENAANAPYQQWKENTEQETHVADLRQKGRGNATRDRRYGS